MVGPYEVLRAIRPSPFGSQTIPTRGEKFDKSSFQYPSLVGPPGSPRNKVPAGAPVLHEGAELVEREEVSNPIGQLVGLSRHDCYVDNDLDSVRPSSHQAYGDARRA